MAVAIATLPGWREAVIASGHVDDGRHAAPAGPDPTHADVFGGRDLQQGGSWLLVSTRGRFAAVTNVRAGTNPEVAPRSRGGLVRGFATGDASADTYVAALSHAAPEYGRFNLLCWDGAVMQFATNHPHFDQQRVAPGLHARSNGAFDAPWPQSGPATRALEAWLDTVGDDVQDTTLAPLFDALADTTPAPDARLPDTGVGLEFERLLSPPFVRGARYGTRCSTVLLIDEVSIVFAERRFGPDSVAQGMTFVQLPRAPMS
jgi:uncharacterized protein with NRDE domain